MQGGEWNAPQWNSLLGCSYLKSNLSVDHLKNQFRKKKFKFVHLHLLY